MEGVRHNHSGEETARKGKGPLVLEVGLHGLEARMPGQVGNAREIAVDCNDAVAAFEKQTGVASRAARDVEDVAAVGDEPRKPNDPG